jgi:hypothetical protein
MTVVRGVGELLEALATADDIEIDGTLSGMSAITLIARMCGTAARQRVSR